MCRQNQRDGKQLHAELNAVKAEAVLLFHRIAPATTGGSH